jgi:hypothetical protein
MSGEFEFKINLIFTNLMFGTELTLGLVYDGVSTNYAQLVVFLASTFAMATIQALQ